MTPSTNHRLNILLLALALRAALILGAWSQGHGTNEPFLAPDSASYLETATSLATTGTFTRAGEPDVVRTPGYPLLLVPGVWLGSPVGWGLTLQMLLSLLAIVIVYDLAHRFGGPRSATVAALLMAIEPLSIIYTAKLLSETAFATLLLCSLWGLVTGKIEHVERRWLFGAACLGASALVRPVGYALVLVLVVVGLVLLVRQRIRRQGPMGASWLVSAIILLLLPCVVWQARNLAVADYRGLSAITDINLYFYQGAAVQARHQDRPFYEVQDEWGYHDVEIFNAHHPDLARLPQGERLQQLGARGRRIVAAHPFVYARIHLQGVLRVIFDPGGVEALRMLGMYPARGGLLGSIVDEGVFATLRQVVVRRPELVITEGVLAAVLALIYLAAAFGVRSIASTRPVLAIVLVGGLLILLFAAGGPMSLSRFRHPMMPVLCLLAGLGCSGVSIRPWASASSSRVSPGGDPDSTASA